MYDVRYEFGARIRRVPNASALYKRDYAELLDCDEIPCEFECLSVYPLDHLVRRNWLSGQFVSGQWSVWMTALFHSLRPQ